jgi:hypothetical protein
MSWSARLRHPVHLADGRVVRTLADARDILLALPISDRLSPQWRALAGLLISSARTRNNAVLMTIANARIAAILPQLDHTASVLPPSKPTAPKRRAERRGRKFVVRRAMRKLVHGTVIDRPRQIIHVVRVIDEILKFAEIDDIAEKMRAYVLSRRGEQMPNVVIVQGNTRENLRLFGDTHAVNRVRAALFNADVSWSPLDLE